MTAAAPLAQRLNAALPQTQCTRCGYPACLPYAQAMAEGSAPPNRCPPGGQDGADVLAALLGLAPLPLNPECGEVKAVETLAVVIEADCIGCTKCIQACPVDAIVGGANLMHTVLADRCTGCELCLPPCPVDCIVMLPAPALPPPMNYADSSLRYYQAHEARLARWATEEAAQRATKRALDPLAAALAKVQAQAEAQSQ